MERDLGMNGYQPITTYGSVDLLWSMPDHAQGLAIVLAYAQEVIANNGVYVLRSQSSRGERIRGYYAPQEFEELVEHMRFCFHAGYPIDVHGVFIQGDHAHWVPIADSPFAVEWLLNALEGPVFP
jgi:hypothetical protein